MAKCKRCGRGGLFRKVNSQGLCPDCAALQEIESTRNSLSKEIEQLEQALNERQSTYDELKASAQKAALDEASQSLQDMERRRNEAESSMREMQACASTAQEELTQREKAASAAVRKVARSKEILKAITYAKKNMG